MFLAKMSANRVTNTSLSLTLPISCQICLGKVKEPVVCPNQHVFCSPCLDLWLRTNRYCPTCRTPINHEQPCKKILGSIDLQVNSDSITKAELRRTRLELIRKEYEDDLTALHNTIERLKVENKRLHERLSEQDKTISALHLSNINHQGKDDGGSKPPTPDLDMLLKLTAKLQEASVTYEQLKNDMHKTSQDNKRLQEENDNLLRETARLKDESLFTKSPQRFSHYSMAAMQTKISQYEKEIQQLKKALTRSDGYIDELNARIEGRTPDGRERASSSAESCHKQSSTIDGSRRSSSVSLEGVNANDNSPQQLADNGEENEDSIADYDRPTMVNVTSFQPVSSSLTTPSQTTANSDDILATPLAEAASAIEAADHWLKAASSKTETSTGITPPDVFYPGSDLASHRLDAKLGIGSTGGVERFPASRQLMLLCERISRQRETVTKLDSAQGAPSPSSSDGGKVPLPKTLDFSDMMGETSSMNGDSPRLTPRLDLLSSNISYDASNSLSAMASCAYTKIKSECQDPSEPTTQAKRIKLEKEESSGFQ